MITFVQQKKNSVPWTSPLETCLGCGGFCRRQEKQGIKLLIKLLHREHSEKSQKANVIKRSRHSTLNFDSRNKLSISKCSKEIWILALWRTYEKLDGLWQSMETASFKISRKSHPDTPPYPVSLVASQRSWSTIQSSIKSSNKHAAVEGSCFMPQYQDVQQVNLKSASTMNHVHSVIQGISLPKARTESGWNPRLTVHHCGHSKSRDKLPSLLCKAKSMDRKLKGKTLYDCRTS